MLQFEMDVGEHLHISAGRQTVYRMGDFVSYRVYKLIVLHVNFRTIIHNWNGANVNFDLTILHAINAFCGTSSTLDHLAVIFRDNNLVKLGPFMAMFWLMWFKVLDRDQNREKLILMLFAVVIALVVNRTLEEMMPFRSRPFLVPDIGLRPPQWGNVVSPQDDNFSSFPSDHAALLFAMVGGFWFVSRPLSLLLSAQAACVLIARIYFGYHFPSDVVVGSLIGVAGAVITNRIFFLRQLAALVVAAERRTPAYFYGAMFIVTFEVADLFEGVRALAKQAVPLILDFGHTVT